jgi:2-polyprenyl-6-methoxyphenol hydroxylase-like FAD-dependent oxidoreductase
MTTNTTLRETRTQVLVVGAGPVGLLAALRLSEQGAHVRVVEQQPEQRTHTFPVVLHPQSLRLLSDLGLSAALYWRGRAVTRLAVYTEHERRAVLDLPRAAGVAPGAMTLPQDILRQALVNALGQRSVAIEWNTRLVVLQQDDGSVWGRLIERDPLKAMPGGTAHGNVSAFEADFVIGADGYESSVREALGIDFPEYGALQTYAFFDAPVRRAGTEAQLALGEDFSSSVYPLQGDVARFSFQIARLLHSCPDSGSLRELIHSRLPWFGEEPEVCEWCGVAEFRQALASQFGRGRVWLAGEAAHLTGPLGVQSLNVGLDEANELALRISDELRHPLRRAFGQEYEARRMKQWRELLGLEERVALSSRSPAWARRYLPRLVSCLPASDADLDDLLDQLRLTPSSGRPHSRAPAG